jgi:hypothetical protein
MNPIQQLALLDDKMMKLKRERESAREHQERKHADWNETYELARNKVRTNRLTQRQAVNLPLMKETIKTILSRVDEAPNVDWSEKSGDELKELIYQEMWNQQYADQKFEWIDVLDKKNVLMYGLSTKFLSPSDKGVDVSVLDVFDIVFDPLMNPFNIETARFIIRQNIFRSLREVLADERYTQEGRDKLKIWSDMPEGIMQSTTNKEEWEKKMDRIKAMGVESNEFATYAGGDVIVNLCEHYTLMWDVQKKEFVKHVVVYADGWCELMDETLEDLIGMDEYPFVVWFEDPETNDIYPDAVADLVRTPNKLLNVWFSQMTENRTLKNFQMHWYDATIDSYTPQTYEPGPGRMLPAPGDPNKTIMPVQVDGLDDTMNAIDFVTRIIERGSGAVAIDKGVSEAGQQTLGEVQILVGKAMERSVSMQKFYRGAWYELATKWDKLMHANPPKRTKLYRTGQSGKLYEKVVYPSDWMSTAGYKPEVKSSSEQEANDVKTIQKFQYVLSQFPDNMELRKIAQRRQLELVDFTPDELKRVNEEEERMARERAQQASAASVQQPAVEQPMQAQMAPQAPQNPEEQQLMSQIEESLGQLA